MSVVKILSVLASDNVKIMTGLWPKPKKNRGSDFEARDTKVKERLSKNYSYLLLLGTTQGFSKKR